MDRGRSERASGRFPLGMNNVLDARELGLKALRNAENVDVDKTGLLRRRDGYTLLTAGYAHSAFSEEDWPFGLAVVNGQLTKLTDVGGSIVQASLRAMAETAPVSYAVMNDRIYYSNGLVTGSLDASGVEIGWGIEEPGGQPLVTTSGSGGFTAGKYQVAIVFVSPSGEESGAEETVEIQVPENAGIMLSTIPQPVGVGYRVRIYCSPPNGDVLYEMATIPAGVLTYFLTNSPPGRVIETLLYSRVPPCTHVRAFKGRLWFVIDDTVFYTDALRYGLYRLHLNYYRFPDRINMFEVVEDGFYVGTAKHTHFLKGTDPAKMVSTVVELHGAVAGTGLQVRGADFGDKVPQGPVVVWWTNKGSLVRGEPGGNVVPLTEGRLSLPQYAAGATMFRELRGMKHLVSTLRDPNGSGFSARDEAVAEVIRNGVTI